MSEKKVKCPACAEEISSNETVCPICKEPLPHAAGPESSDSKSEISLYSPKEAALFSLVLTPVFGSFIIWSNWKTLQEAQQEKVQKIWMIALSAVFIIAYLFFDVGYDCGVILISLVVWYVLSCQQQMKYLTEKNIVFQKKKWKTIAIRGVLILICTVAVLEGVFYVFQGPTIDCSSDEAYIKSFEKVVADYTKKIDFKAIEEREKKYGDATKEDKEKVMNLFRMKMFMLKRLTEEEKEEIDGMSAKQLIKYLNKKYEQK